MVAKREDWIGRRFGKLEVIELERIRGIGSIPICRCDCGSEIKASMDNLLSGGTTSCGCHWLSRITKHGKSRSRTYTIWKCMRSRCNNPKTFEYHNYGGRGITVCDRWQTSFENFLSDMGECPPDLSIDRINKNGNYEPNNCRWATMKEQLNNRRNCRYVTAFCRTQTLTQWAEEYKLPVTTLKNRLFRAKMGPEEALTAPLYAQQRKKRKLDEI